MKLTGHAWFPTNSQRTFLPSSSPTTSPACFLTSFSSEKRLHQRLNDQGFLCPEWHLAEPSPSH